MKVEVNAPMEFTSPVSTILNKRHAVILGQDSRDDWITIESEVPLNDMFGFSAELRGLTQGKGRFYNHKMMISDTTLCITLGEYTMEYSRYAPALDETQQRLVNEYQKEQEAEELAATGGKKKRNR